MIVGFPALKTIMSGSSAEKKEYGTSAKLAEALQFFYRFIYAKYFKQN